MAQQVGQEEDTGPRIVTAPPGPKSQAAMARKERFVTRGLKVSIPVEIVHGEGPFVDDADGNRYIDLGTGIGVHNIGHRPAAVVAAAKAQLDLLTHTCFMVNPYAGYISLAERMAGITPDGLEKSIFLNSGSEAVENAIKVARAATGRGHIISFRTAFHGRTLAGISLTGKERPYREGFGPFVGEFLHADYPYAYRDRDGRSPAESAKARLEEIEDLVTKGTADGDVAAIIAEPVQGEGGFIVPPKEFFPGLRRLCDDHGIVLIDDEVQAGMGRTGRMWAIEHWSTKPDLLVSGKAVAGGLPFGGVTGTPELMDAPNPGSLGGTFGGNPVVCAAALATIDSVEAALPSVAPLEAIIDRRMREIASTDERIGDVRGLGAMWAFEFVRDPKSKEPAPEVAVAVQREALARGLILLTAGFHNNCIRLLPPLNMPTKLMENAFDLLGDAVAAALKST